MGRRHQTEPVAGQRQVATGIVALVPDRDGRRGWTMLVNGVPSSHVDLDDPLRLDFEYARWIAGLLDLTAPEGDPLRVAHLGGGGCTLPRYVATTRRSPASWCSSSTPASWTPPGKRSGCVPPGCCGCARVTPVPGSPQSRTRAWTSWSGTRSPARSCPDT